MKIKSKSLQEACAKLESVIDPKILPVTSVVQLVSTADKNELNLSITDFDYYVKVTIPGTQGELNTTVDATLFFALIKSQTVEDIELLVENGNLIIKGNGEYKIGCSLDDDGKQLEIPEMVINIVEKAFDFPKATVDSISKKNADELKRGVTTSPLQRYFYIDKDGAVTFTSGACINSFPLTIDSPIMLIATQVNCFKLFSADPIKAEIGDNLLVMKEPNLYVALRIKNEYKDQFPVQGIRGQSTKEFPIEISLTRDDLLDSIGRVLPFFVKSLENFVKLKVDGKIFLVDPKQRFKDESECKVTKPGTYEALIDIKTLSSVLNSCSKEIQLKLGDETCFLIVDKNVSYVIPEGIE